jgi:cyclic pyranopterin monophosphate synthase
MSMQAPGRGDERSDPAGLTHLDARGRARMVDVMSKPLTRRLAAARCAVVTVADAAQALGETALGLDPVEAARFAGMQAAKQTSSLIPLCHPIHIDRVSVEVDVQAHRIEVRATAEITERTGVEMEALTACAMTALTLVAALAHADREATVEDLTLWHKSGGRSGNWERTGPGARLAPSAVPAAPDGMAQGR